MQDRVDVNEPLRLLEGKNNVRMMGACGFFDWSLAYKMVMSEGENHLAAKPTCDRRSNGEKALGDHIRARHH
jgi:hypothetical protein